MAGEITDMDATTKAIVDASILPLRCAGGNASLSCTIRYWSCVAASLTSHAILATLICDAGVRSIIIVGVGSNDFDRMNILDGDCAADVCNVGS